MQSAYPGPCLPPAGPKSNSFQVVLNHPITCVSPVTTLRSLPSLRCMTIAKEMYELLDPQPRCDFRMGPGPLGRLDLPESLCLSQPLLSKLLFIRSSMPDSSMSRRRQECSVAIWPEFLGRSRGKTTLPRGASPRLTVRPMKAFGMFQVFFQSDVHVGS